MSTNLSAIVSNRKPATYAKVRFIWLLIATMALALAASVCLANDYSSQVPAKKANLPEAILVPMKLGGRPIASGGWILTYRNGLSGSEVPDREVQMRSVIFFDHMNNQVAASVSWEIRRTQNNSCASRSMELCPDMLRVLSVPEGFVAVPESVWVDEGTSLRIRIVPAGVS